MQVTVKLSVRLPCPPAQGWELLHDLAGIQDWGPGIASATAEALEVGAERHIRLARPMNGQDAIVERIVDVDEREFTYEMVDGFGPFPSVLTTWRIGVHPSRVIVGSTIELPKRMIPLAPIAKARWRKELHKLASGFAAHCAK